MYLCNIYYSWKKNSYTTTSGQVTIREGYEIHSSLLVNGKELIKSSTSCKQFVNEFCIGLQPQIKNILPDDQDVQHKFFWDQDQNKDSKHTHPVSRFYVKYIFFIVFACYVFYLLFLLVLYFIYCFYLFGQKRMVI